MSPWDIDDETLYMMDASSSLSMVPLLSWLDLHHGIPTPKIEGFILHIQRSTIVFSSSLTYPFSYLSNTNKD